MTARTARRGRRLASLADHREFGAFLRAKCEAVRRFRLEAIEKGFPEKVVRHLCRAEAALLETRNAAENLMVAQHGDRAPSGFYFGAVDGRRDAGTGGAP